ncbi:MAG: type II toxin-antitoxin system Phd/YefM family antitoxin [Rhodobacteraceae bacterium]|nr:type II toxin-antitoxin system Phd/YefM family antitoxin [Paracoccaceae bacterium]MCY4195909.1 type II toxin-antitoxin system Phd/YefM family antitoxin [Paracoccaceae bacterium]MCY4326253.1 type II toxin-antitoxin system Phd/YefM family antitoxin [Paracoccaceae bacterium]
MTWSLQDAKNRFSAVVSAALSGRPQEVTRRGRPAVVVISCEEYHRLLEQAGSTRGRFTDHLMDFPSEVAERAASEPRDVTF